MCTTSILTDRLPLTSHASDDIIAHDANGPIYTAQFIADARTLAAKLPSGRYMLNVCHDRYRFMTGLAASLISGKISLLPSTHTPETIRDMQAFSPDVFCLADEDNSINLPQFLYQSQPEKRYVNQIDNTDMPFIAHDTIAAYVFTSGSTGSPIPHAKSWGALVRGAQAGTQRLGLGTPCSIVGTTPPQHMYGLETTVMFVLHGHCTIWTGHPFFAADIAHALALTPEPRMLVTTPFHLQIMLDSTISMPLLSKLISATAPLSVNLAVRAERVYHAPLYEIYGSTETGQLATRQTALSTDWQLMPDIRMRQEEGRWIAKGGHIDDQAIIPDQLEFSTESYFQLKGRSQDLINIAGKRSSLAFLNEKLSTIPEVKEGYFFIPNISSEATHITRLCAVVIASPEDKPKIMTKLRQYIDPVFLPRPLIFVDTLPRTPIGKITRTGLLNILEAHLQQKRSWTNTHTHSTNLDVGNINNLLPQSHIHPVQTQPSTSTTPTYKAQK